MFQCFHCFHGNISAGGVRCEFCGSEGATDAVGMENAEMQDLENVIFGSNERGTIAVTSNEVGRDSNFQSFEIALASLDEYFLEDNPIDSSESSSHTSETTSSRSYGCNHQCDSVGPMDLNFNSAVAASKHFDVLSGSSDQQFCKDTVNVSDENRIISGNSPPRRKSAATFQGNSVMHDGKAMKIDAASPNMIDFGEFNISSTHKDSSIFYTSTGSKLNLASSDNIFFQNKKTTENNPADKKRKDEIYLEGGKNNLNYRQQRDKPMKLGVEGVISSDNRALVNIVKTFLSDISDSGTPKGENIGDMPAVAGLSGFQRSQQQRNSRAQVLHSNYASEIPSVKMREQYLLICKVCKKEVGEHLLKEGNVYRCCVCGFHAVRKVCLQMHSYTHCRELTCSICGKNHREGDLHDSEHACDVCKIKIPCRTRYGEHLLLEDHRVYLKKNCWACRKKISDHWILGEEGKTFACCFCNYNNSTISNFRKHNRNHLPNFYCSICREEYCKEERSLHDREFSCWFCPQVYQCQTELEEHTRISHNNISTDCRFCGSRIDGHIASKDGNEFKKCCVCKTLFPSEADLQNHLYEHTGLKLFKCEACGKRFTLKSQVSGHSTSCMAYKCEVCGATFPRNEYLTMHRSEIHINK